MNVAELREAMRASRKTVTVSVDGFGDVSLRSLDATDGMRITKLAADFKDVIDPELMAAFWIELLALSIVDENGKHGFNDDDGREVLRGLQLGALSTLGNAAVTLNGMTQDDDAKKNGS